MKTMAAVEMMKGVITKDHTTPHFLRIKFMVSDGRLLAIFILI